MEKFKITVEQRQKFDLIVEAEDEEEAIQLTSQMIADEMYDLPDEDEIEKEVKIAGRIFV